ncbi:MAG: hypothetical protein CO141_00470 [Candidatus Moranbacteria bacterium CG_4_9_14_3_um_filter_42_9]|nr:MAG: hypothetical protein CO141_00470 [Candidatus Moranbacteria bacterium CG_4_9_14_3_um_filter_42_9]
MEINMLDDIGLGSAIANLIYLIIITAGFIVAWFFFKKKLIFEAIFSISATLNFFFYLYFMGNYRLYPKFFYPVVNKYWPWINVAFLALLIVNYIKKRNAETNQSTIFA